MLHLRTPADTAALLLCVEGIATYRNARLIEDPHGWRAICAALGGPSYRVNESLWQALLIAEHRRALANSEISLGLYLAGEASFDRTHPLTA